MNNKECFKIHMFSIILPITTILGYILDGFIIYKFNLNGPAVIILSCVAAGLTTLHITKKEIKWDFFRILLIIQLIIPSLDILLPKLPMNFSIIPCALMIQVAFSFKAYKQIDNDTLSPIWRLNKAMAMYLILPFELLVIILMIATSFTK